MSTQTIIKTTLTEILIFILIATADFEHHLNNQPTFTAFIAYEPYKFKH